MIVFKKQADLIAFLEAEKQKGQRIGFVPTMGALHQGHISLVNNSVTENGVTLCSIFVNPTQFNDAGDFEKYPITIAQDIDMLEKAGVQALFLPDVKEVYPAGTLQLEEYDLGFLETILEASFRPGHFQGVCQVVHRLLDIVKPHNLYLGQKDYQQCMVIKKLVEITGATTDVIVCPTLREKDGLAMSSRNMRLSPGERKQAVKVSATLAFIKKNIKPGLLDELKETAIRNLTAEGFKVDYVEIAAADSLQPVNNWDGRQTLVALIAAFLNEVRLIDNMILNREPA